MVCFLVLQKKNRRTSAASKEKKGGLPVTAPSRPLTEDTANGTMAKNGEHVKSGRLTGDKRVAQTYTKIRFAGR